MMGLRLAVAAILGVASLALPACTGGTTPDCSDGQCGVTIAPEADIDALDAVSEALPPTDGGPDGG